MFKKIIDFIKYNNFFIVILVICFMIGSGVFAQTETGQAFIGQKQTKTEGVDNTLLIAADLDDLKMDYKIEKIEQDESYYYVTYTFIDLINKNSAWQYEMTEKTRKVSKKMKADLGLYMAGQLQQDYEARIKDLKSEQAKAKGAGPAQRQEVTEYSGLIGGLLDTVAKVIPAYEPVKKINMPAPASDLLLGAASTTPDDLDGDGLADELDNCPLDSNPEQVDTDSNGIGDLCDINIIIDQILNEPAVSAAEAPSAPADENPGSEASSTPSDNPGSSAPPTLPADNTGNEIPPAVDSASPVPVEPAVDPIIPETNNNSPEPDVEIINELPAE